MTQPPRRYLRPFGNDRLSLVATIVLILLLLAGLLAPLLPIGDPEAIGAGPRLSPPGGGFPLGTDNLGRPMLARIFEGILLTFIVSMIAVLIASVVGAVVGMIAAYTHRALDETVSRIADMLFSFPPVLLRLLITAILSPGIHSAVRSSSSPCRRWSASCGRRPSTLPAGTSSSWPRSPVRPSAVGYSSTFCPTPRGSSPAAYSSAC